MWEDVVLLAEGDRVPADAIVLDTVNLTVDESLLTGESVPVRTRAVEGTGMGRPGGDGSAFVFSGTLVVKGQGVARVAATGTRSELGQIGEALNEVVPGKTRLEVDVARLVKWLAILGLCLAALIVVFYGMTRGGWLDAFLAGITFAMAMLPEEFPVVLTIFLALGAWRISQRTTARLDAGAHRFSRARHRSRLFDRVRRGRGGGARHHGASAAQRWFEGYKLARDRRHETRHFGTPGQAFGTVLSADGTCGGRGSARARS